MTRREWLLTAPAVAGVAGLGWSRPRQGRPLLEMTPAEGPLVTGSQLGFRPDSPKRILIQGLDPGKPANVLIVDEDGSSRTISAPTPQVSAFDIRACAVLLNDLRPNHSYRASILSDKTRAGESFAFTIARDAWLRQFPILAGYAHHQRCGHSDRREHPICHLDDARRRDTGIHVDVTGGWHDAGDLRKWVDATLMNLFGLTALARRLSTNPDAFPLRMEELLDEARYGNAFFLKMQDPDGLVWADVGGGVRGDNSDNHWTDNQNGTADDRFINVEKRPAIQAMFVAAQAIMYQLFSKSDAPYAARCLSAALRCWKASARQAIANTTDLAWRTLAAAQLCSATSADELQQDVIALASQLEDLQVKNPAGGGATVRGFFPMWTRNQQPLRDAVHSAIPPVALLEAARSIATHDPANAKKWRRAVRLYLDEYAIPMATVSAYGVVPFGLFLDTPPEARDAERYRALSGRYSYRFFMPVKTKAGYAGLSSHLLSHALLFAAAEREFGDSRYRDAAYAHLEWIFGANPFGASLVTGIGIHQPPAFSPFVGLIPGGIMNGVCGNAEDQPVLDQENATEWRTNEYWSPHSGYCNWALSLLEAPRA
jgi:hypothetical protein